MVAQLCESTKNHSTIHFKCLSCMYINYISVEWSKKEKNCKRLPALPQKIEYDV